jgi:hypothetical protein
MARGVARFDSVVFGDAEAREILELIRSGDRDVADDKLRHYVHVGVAPTVLFEQAMTLERHLEGEGGG